MKNASKLQDYRPISLCNTTYKIVVKILTLCLRPVMDKLIGPYQASFLRNRQTTDNASIVQKVINHFKKMKGKAASFIQKTGLRKGNREVQMVFSTLHIAILQLPREC